MSVDPRNAYDLAGGSEAGYEAIPTEQAFSTFAAPSVVAHAATGVAATDTAMLQEAIDDCPQGGRLWISHGEYALNTALHVPRSMTIEGDGAAATYVLDTYTNGGSASMAALPGATGVTLLQTAENTNILDLTQSGASVNLSRLALVFDESVEESGHGVNASPSTEYRNGHDLGILDFLWSEIYVSGHDGDHYGFRLLNPLNGTLTNMRSYNGGGGYWIGADDGGINAGNLVLIHPYCTVAKIGTGCGVAMHAFSDSTHPGMVNFCTFVRPQVVNNTGATTPGQLAWDEYASGTAWAKNNTIIGLDLENWDTVPRISKSTAVIGTSYITRGNAKRMTGVILGTDAAGEVPEATGAFVAIGHSALKSLTTGDGCTGVGYQAAAEVVNATGVTGVGYQAAYWVQAANVTGVGYLAASGGGSSDRPGESTTAVGSNACRFVTGVQNTGVGHNALLGVSGSSTAALNTGVGFNTLKVVTTAGSNSALGHSALSGVTTGQFNTGVGRNAGSYSDGTTANAVTTGNSNTFVGHESGHANGSSSFGTAIGQGALVHYRSTSLGYKVAARAVGAVAIGVDSAGTSASTTVQDEIALGTALHQVKIANNATGAGTPTVGTNCPAIDPTTPYTWLKMTAGDGSTVFIPAWK